MFLQRNVLLEKMANDTMIASLVVLPASSGLFGVRSSIILFSSKSSSIPDKSESGNGYFFS